MVIYCAVPIVAQYGECQVRLEYTYYFYKLTSRRDDVTVKVGSSYSILFRSCGPGTKSARSATIGTAWHLVLAESTVSDIRYSVLSVWRIRVSVHDLLIRIV